MGHRYIARAWLRNLAALKCHHTEVLFCDLHILQSLENVKILYIDPLDHSACKYSPIQQNFVAIIVMRYFKESTSKNQYSSQTCLLQRFLPEDSSLHIPKPLLLDSLNIHFYPETLIIHVSKASIS